MQSTAQRCIEKKAARDRQGQAESARVSQRQRCREVETEWVTMRYR